MQLYDKTICVIDVESTGIFVRDEWAEIVEIGAIIVRHDGTIRFAFNSLVRPQVLDSRADEAMKVNEINPKELSNEDEFPTVFGEFMEAVARLNVDFFTSFNTDFDEAAFRKHGVRFLNWGPCIMKAAYEVGVMGEERERYNCETGELVNNSYPSLKRCLSAFQITPREPAHKAYVDAWNAVQVMNAVQSIKRIW